MTDVKSFSKFKKTKIICRNTMLCVSNLVFVFCFMMWNENIMAAGGGGGNSDCSGTIGGWKSKFLSPVPSEGPSEALFPCPDRRIGIGTINPVKMLHIKTEHGALSLPGDSHQGIRLDHGKLFNGSIASSIWDLEPNVDTITGQSFLNFNNFNPLFNIKNNILSLTDNGDIKVSGNFNVSGNTVINTIKTNKITSIDTSNTITFGDNTLYLNYNTHKIYTLNSATGLPNPPFDNGITIGDARLSTLGGLAGGLLRYFQLKTQMAVPRFSTAIGYNLRVAPGAEYAMVLGSGATTGDVNVINTGYLENNKPMSLMIGFNSNIPTFFIGPAVGINQTGKVGIGTSNPSATLHISGIGDQDLQLTSTLKGSETKLMSLSSNGINESQLQFTGRFSFIKPLGSQGGIVRMVINENGNVGIGTDDPQKILETNGGGVAVQNGIRITNYVPTLYFKNQIYTDGHDWHISVAEVGSNATLAFKDETANAYRFVINENGNVGIGTTNPQSTLAVNGRICAKDIRIALSGQECWPDYVFDQNYKLVSFEDRIQWVLSNKKLPGMKTAEEINKEGLDLGETMVNITRNVEELTLYDFKLYEMIYELKQEIEILKKENSELRNK